MEFNEQGSEEAALLGNDSSRRVRGSVEEAMLRSMESSNYLVILFGLVSVAKVSSK
mgnify:FL=1